MFKENLKFTFDIDQYNIVNMEVRKNLNMKLWRELQKNTLYKINSVLYDEISCSIDAKGVFDV